MGFLRDLAEKLLEAVEYPIQLSAKKKYKEDGQHEQ